MAEEPVLFADDFKELLGEDFMPDNLYEVRSILFCMFMFAYWHTYAKEETILPVPKLAYTSTSTCSNIRVQV